MGTTYSFCCGCCCGCCARCGVGLPRLPRFAPVVGDTDGDDGGDSEALPVATAAAFGPRSPSGGATAPIHALCGTWYVTHSTLDMWSKNTHPRITYDLLGAASEATSLTGAKGGAGTAGPVVLRDTVVYRAGTGGYGRVKTIHGHDTMWPADAEDLGDSDDDVDDEYSGLGGRGGPRPPAFTWRGSGCLAPVTSHWCFVAHDAAAWRWAITYFSATPFTAEGVDVYCRTPKMDDATFTEVMACIQSCPVLEGKAAGLFPTHQSGGSG